MRTLVVATTNPGKVREIREVLGDAPVTLRTLADYPPVVAPEETGSTFAENARQKALYYADALGELVAAEDSGLEVDAMGGAPGVHSARFGGEQSTYPEKFALIFQALDAAGLTTSPARFVCALALVDGGDVRFEARGTVEGQIAREPKGAGGFGYDPIFYYPPFGCTLAEADHRKNTVSHRGAAFRALKEWLDTNLQVRSEK